MDFLPTFLKLRVCEKFEEKAVLVGKSRGEMRFGVKKTFFFGKSVFFS